MHAALRLYRETRFRLRPLRSSWRAAHGALLQRLVEARWRRRRPARRHALPARLIVSLTSYPPRFHALDSTIKCLLSQSLRPDLVVLWLAPDDRALLPVPVRALQREGLRIETCADIGPFKKLVPARQRWRGAFIATADDDAYYPRTWLAELVSGWSPLRPEIPCHRAHVMKLTPDGAPAPYADWRFEARKGEASPLTFPTGVGGVLYPPGSQHPDVTDASLFTILAPTSDDAWFYWMARRQGWRFRRVTQRRFVCWPHTQGVALQHANVAGENVVQIARLAAHFGLPIDAAQPARCAGSAKSW